MENMAGSSQATPFGIEQLMGLKLLVVRQKTTKFSNKYVVTAEDDKEIFYVNEDSTQLHSVLDGYFQMDVCNPPDNQIISLHRPYSVDPDRLEVSVCGELSSVIRWKPTFLKPRFTINSPDGEPLFKIKGSLWTDVECDFNIYAMDKMHIGTITKKWSMWKRFGKRKRYLFRTNGFDIQFLIELDVFSKVAVLGTCMLIDFVLYED